MTRLFFVSALIIGVLLPSSNASAYSDWSSASLDWSASFDVFSHTDTCYVDRRRVFVDGSGYENVCVYGNPDGFLLASYRDNQDFPSYAVSFAGSDKFYKTNACSGLVGCVYSTATDTLYGIKDGIAIEYRNLSTSLGRISETNFHNEKYIAFVYTRPFINSALNDSFASVSISRNGFWLAWQKINDGFTVQNVVTGDVRSFPLDLPQVYYNPPQHAISNDGNHLTSYYVNYGLAVMTYGASSPVIFNDFNKNDTIFFALNISFSDDDKSISFDGRLVYEVARKFVFKKSTSEKIYGPDYIAFGDSFTSGEGEIDDNMYQKLTNINHEKCHTSLRSYPYLVGSYWGVSAKSVACSGAVISDIFGFGNYSGQGSRLSSSGHNLGDSDIKDYQNYALHEFVPGRVRQIEFVSRYQPAVVSVGVGGNDAGLMAKLKSCIGLDVCEWLSPENKGKVIREVQALVPRYTALISEISKVSPRTSIVVVGYPTPLIEPGSNCPLYINAMLTDAEKDFFNETVIYLNRIIEHAVSLSQNAKFISLDKIYTGHSICSKLNPAISAIRFGDDIVPVLGIKLIGAESFHPTPFGHELAKKRITRTLPAPPEPRVSHGYMVAVANPIPEPSDYWQVTTSSVLAKHLPSILSDSIKTGALSLVSVADGLFDPNTEVLVEIHSKPQVVFVGKSSSDGSFVANVNIPHLDRGYHTIFVKGTNIVGEKIELYDTFEVKDSSEAQQTVSAQGKTNSSSEVVGLATSHDGATVLSATIEDENTRSPAQNKSDSLQSSGSPAIYRAVYVSIVMAVIYIIARYIMGYMNLRKIIKKVIPSGLFRKIEPIGHLFESVLMNVVYGFPSRKLKVIGVTGTNGKTTTSFFIHKMLHEAGINVALTTTVGYGVGSDIKTQTQHITTAQSGVLQKRLKGFVKSGAEWVVVETSSHALAQHRVWGLPYEVAVMTNITHDHLDYHGSIDNYRNAKIRLFKLANKRGLKYGVVNADDPSAPDFIGSIENAETYGIQSGDLKASNIKLTSDGSTFDATIEGDLYKIKVNIPGLFNVSNALAAVLVGRKLGLTRKQIETGIASLDMVDGRMNVINEGQPFKVIVDFASTPDGFEKLFSSVRPLVKGKLIAVFGSAGRRDESKRAVQGEIAGSYADVVVVTEEDDRDEDGLLILKQIAKGAQKSGKVPGESLFLEQNRESAIGFALAQASSVNDTVVILGKGHEKTIERADGEHPWSDEEVTRSALQELIKKLKSKQR